MPNDTKNPIQLTLPLPAPEACTKLDGLTPPVRTGTVVAPLKTTNVVPSITVVLPLSGSSELTCTVVGPEKTSSNVPPITVKLPGSRGTVVGPVRTTNVVPEITVWLPCNGRFGLTGTVVALEKTSNVEPSITVICPGKAGTEVAEGITKNGVPSIVVVEPTRPAGAAVTGMLVGPGMKRNGVPFTTVVLKTLAPAGRGIVVGCRMTKGVPFIVVVLPSPAGTSAAGTVVALGMTKTGVPDMNDVLPRLAGMGWPPEGGVMSAAGEPP